MPFDWDSGDTTVTTRLGKPGRWTLMVRNNVKSLGRLVVTQLSS